MNQNPLRNLKKKLPETICFRLPENYMQTLLGQSQARQCSQNELARQLVIDHLEDSVREKIENRLVEATSEVTLLRGDMAILAEALLVVVSGGKIGAQEAQEWVELRLRQAARKET